MYKKLLKVRKKAVVLFIAGVAASFFLQRNSGAIGAVFFSDMFFTVSMTFLLFALWELAMNFGVFNSLVFGAKSLYRLVRSKLDGSERVKDDYLAYVQSRGKYGDVALLLIIGAAFLVFSIAISFI